MSVIASAIVAGVSSIGGPALFMGGAGLVSGIGGALLQSNAAQKASAAQTGLGYAALNQQKQLYGNASNALQPFISAGSNVLPALTGLVGGGSGGGPSPSALANNPVLKFLSQYGTMATTNALSSRGLGASAGPVATAVGNYNVGLANTFWGDVVNKLQGVAGMGGAAAGALGGISGNFANTFGNTLTGIGGAQASGIMGSANALAGGLSGGANSIANAYLLSSLLGKGGGGGAGMYPSPQVDASWNNPSSAAVPNYGSPWG